MSATAEERILEKGLGNDTCGGLDNQADIKDRNRAIVGRREKPIRSQPMDGLERGKGEVRERG